jgi:hypothetical protein
MNWNRDWFAPIPASLIVTVDLTVDVTGEVEGLLRVLESKMPLRGLQ